MRREDGTVASYARKWPPAIPTITTPSIPLCAASVFGSAELSAPVHRSLGPWRAWVVSRPSSLGRPYPEARTRPRRPGGCASRPAGGPYVNTTAFLPTADRCIEGLGHRVWDGTSAGNTWADHTHTAVFQSFAPPPSPTTTRYPLPDSVCRGANRLDSLVAVGPQGENMGPSRRGKSRCVSPAWASSFH